MNKTLIIGNLTKDPELRSTASGVAVCTFTVAVNKKKKSNAAKDERQETEYYRVTVWRGQGESCAKYLTKGRKVFVSGTVSASAYLGNDGAPRASLELEADDVEFLSPKPGGQGGYKQDEDEFPI